MIAAVVCNLYINIYAYASNSETAHEGMV